MEEPSLPPAPGRPASPGRSALLPQRVEWRSTARQQRPRPGLVRETLEMLRQGRGSWGAKRRLTTGASLPRHHENLGSFPYLSRRRPRPPPGGLERGSRAGGGQGCSAQACHGLDLGTGPSFQLASVPPCQGHGEAGRPDEAPGPSCLSFERSWDTEARHLGAAPGPWGARPAHSALRTAVGCSKRRPSSSGH